MMSIARGPNLRTISSDVIARPITGRSTAFQLASIAGSVLSSVPSRSNAIAFNRVGGRSGLTTAGLLSAMISDRRERSDTNGTFHLRALREPGRIALPALPRCDQPHERAVGAAGVARHGIGVTQA